MCLSQPLGGKENNLSQRQKEQNLASLQTFPFIFMCVFMQLKQQAKEFLVN